MEELCSTACVCVCVLPYVFDKILQVEFLSPLSHNVSLHFSTKQIVQKNKKKPTALSLS